MKSMLVMLMMVLSGLAIAQQKLPAGTGVGDLLPFVQKFKGVFPSEIKDASAFEKSYQGRLRLVWNGGHGLTYDDANSQLTLDLSDSYLVPQIGEREREVLHQCKVVGRGTGMTAMRVPINYRKRVCNEVITNTVQSEAEQILTVPATPAIYRMVNENGIEIVTIVKPEIGSEVVVEYKEDFEAATLDVPAETQFHLYTITAQVLERRYYLPGAKIPFHTR